MWSFNGRGNILGYAHGLRVVGKLIVSLVLLGILGCAGMTAERRQAWENFCEAIIGNTQQMAIQNQMNYQQTQIRNLELQRQFGPGR